MPRIPTSLRRCARHISPLLPLLLRPCRDLTSARNELRWLREHIIATTTTIATTSLGKSSRRSTPSKRRWRGGALVLLHLYKLCVQRAGGTPLQYILGNQPFGELEILCRKGVLIPRQETEAYTTRIATLVLQCDRTAPKFRILDLCSGTGCISLLLHVVLSTHQPRLEILGIDNSNRAVALAKQNLNHNIALGHLPRVARDQIQFLKSNIFSDTVLEGGNWDMVISNPPYISPRSFNKDTSRSVRNYEPKLALVPTDSPSILTDLNPMEKDMSIGDSFYPRLLEIAETVNASTLLLEVADMEQAKRVVAQAIKLGSWNMFEIWRDWPNEQLSEILVDGTVVRVIGDGDGRSVIARRKGMGEFSNDRMD